MQAQRQYRVAAVQFEPQHSEKAANLDRLEALVREAAANDAKIIVTPEMATIGSFWHGRDEIEPHVEPIPGPTSDRFAALARELSVYITLGMGEVDPKTGIFYNAAILVGPDGLVGKHRKVHGYLSDPMWAADGDLGFQVWDTPLGKLGILICMDANYPESSRLLALDGADVLLIPVNWVVEVCPAPLWINRAFDNQRHAICANRWGAERGFSFSGGAGIIDPDGSLQTCVGHSEQDTIVYGDVDLNTPKRDTPPYDETINLLADRRPNLYQALTLNRYIWNAEALHSHFGANALPSGDRFQAVVWQSEQTQSVSARLAGLDDWVTSNPADIPFLFVLPAFSFSNVPTTRQSAEQSAETLDSATITTLSAWCQQSGHYLVANLVEKDGDALYNTVVLVGEHGLLARYRKTHLDQFDKSWATPGPRFEYANTRIGRIGLLTGTDLLFAEPSRCLAIEGVDIICAPSALVGPEPIRQSRITHETSDDGIIHWHFAQTRAAESDVYIAFANRAGNEHESFMGHSGIFFGPSLFSADEVEAFATERVNNDTTIACLEVDTRVTNPVAPDNALRAKPSLTRRLTDRYQRLLE